MTLENAGTIPLGEILIVEDNAVNLITLLQIIKTAGYRVRNAVDGDKALAAIAEKHPDLVLLDILIPGVNGIDVCKRLKENPLTFEIPIIFLSGKDEIEIKVSAFEAGGADYITKPFHPVEVLSRIKTHLEMSRKISDLKKAQETLRESEEKFRNLFNNAEVGMFRSRLDGSMLLDLNDKYLSILGSAREETIGKPSTILWADPKEREEMVKTLTAKGHVDELEFRLIKKDGSIIDCLTSLRLYPDQGILVGSIMDITERKRMEKELQNARKLESLGVLAGGIAHDFNNLMGGIFGYIDLALEDCEDPKISRYLAKTMNTIERARGLTQQLLTFSKGGSPVRKLDDLFPFIQETVQFALSGSNVSCGFTVAENLWSSNFDKNQIGQVIDNIVINAQQAMPSGGAIEISAENISFTEKKHPALANGEYVRISIKDHGVGIPQEILPRIFDPFYTTKTKGHGLGLATCYSIVNRHGGCIDVESQPGKGSVFHMYLPAEKDPAPKAKAAEIVKHKGSGTFLVMDDQEVIRETIGDMLTSLGYTVVYRENGSNAVDFVKTETAARRKISAMMFDLTVPGGMGGKEAIPEIRKLCPKTPVFVASGYAEDPIMADPKAYGFTASICKPFRKADLVKLLNANMKKKGS
jgi:PAS domain S-box-containing protein